MVKKLLIILFIILFACSHRSLDAVLHPIPTLIVEEGIIKGFDLSVYIINGAIQLTVLPHPDLDLQYIEEYDSLYITPKAGAPRLLRLSAMADGQTIYLLVRITPRVKHTFTYKPKEEGQNVVVMGGFNDWSRSALPLADEDGDGILERTVYLRPERHEYKFVVDHEELIDPGNPVFISNNIGGWNSILDLSEFKQAPAGQYFKSKRQGKKLVFGFLPPEDGNLPAYTFVFFNNQQLHNDVFDPQPDGGLEVNIRNLDDGLLRVTGLDGKGRVISENHTIIKDGKPLHPRSHPDDWHFAVLYNLMIDRFLDGDPANTQRAQDKDLQALANFHGGDFNGIINKLKEGYFRELGVSTIWLSPVQRQPDRAYVEWVPPNRKFTGYHGYWPIEPRQVDPRFGTEEELKTLVSIAHEQGIKVILDLVTNHVHEEHIYFKGHRDWFGQVELPDGGMNIRNWSEETRLTTWFDSFIPSFDYSNAPKAIEQVVDDALWWLETFNFDGFRQDAVKHVPHSFWRALTAEMNLRLPAKELYQIGETFGSDELILSYVNPAELSSQFNFAIYFNARDPFSSDVADFNHLANVIENNLQMYQPVNLMGNITSSHDQVRFMAFADRQLTFSDNGTERSFHNPPGPVQHNASYRKLASFHAFNMTIPGVPIVYYGDEIGLMGAGDPDNRRPLKFDGELTIEEQTLLEETSNLIQLRRSYPALSLGDFIPLFVEGPTLIFAKTYFDEMVFIAFHQSPDQRTVSIPLPFSESIIKDFSIADELQLIDNQIRFELEPYSYQIQRLY